MAYLSDIEIAQACEMKPIAEIARDLGMAETDKSDGGKNLRRNNELSVAENSYRLYCGNIDEKLC